MENPFIKVVETINKENTGSASYRFGVVSSVDPLKVDVNSTTQDENDLLKNSNITSFEIGERLLLIPIDKEQRYIILCKVVEI
ncbi:MAG: hypothetical protein K0R00_3219 [Herbinix sp.]|jgi:hypothetical protein|nr:hypothetical protein [Herbinix sp.]